MGDSKSRIANSLRQKACKAQKGESFLLLNLPLELQYHIYRKYYEDVVIKLCECSGKLDFHGSRILPLELTCWEVHIQARKIREECFNRHLVILAETFLNLNRLDEFTEPQFTWLRRHIRSLELVDQENMHVPDLLWLVIVKACPNLQEVYLTLLRSVCPDHNFVPDFQLADDDGSYVEVVFRDDLDAVVHHALRFFELRKLARALREAGRHGLKVEALVSLRVASCDEVERYLFTLDVMTDVTPDGCRITERSSSALDTHSYWCEGMDSASVRTIQEIEDDKNRREKQETTLALPRHTQENFDRWFDERARPRTIRDDEIHDGHIETCR